CGATTPEQQQQVTAVIDRFRQGDATFLRPLVGRLEPETYVDITHESLIRLWKKLRDEWLPQEQLAAKTLVQIAERARNRKGGSGELLAGLDLARVEAWDAARNKTEAWAEHYVDAATIRDSLEFIDASRMAERRQRRRKLAVRAVLVLVPALVAGTFLILFIHNQQLKIEINERQAAEEKLLQEHEAERRAQAERDLKAAESAVAEAAHPAAVTGSKPGPATPAQPDTRPVVYIQVRGRSEMSRAEALAGPLGQAGFSVPAPQVVYAGPSANEGRYFRTEERADANQIVDVLAGTGLRNVRPVYVSGFGNADRVHRTQFGLWVTAAG